jgi:hypothetical protein
MATGRIAGAVVVVVDRNGPIFSKGYGFADVAARTPVSPDATLFRPGSVSKLLTWTAVMQQVEAGRIDLDADVNRYLDFKIPPFEGKPVTMRQIMTHTAGFQESIRYLITTDGGAVMPRVCPGHDARLFQLRHRPCRVYRPAGERNAVRGIYRAAHPAPAGDGAIDIPSAAAVWPRADDVARLQAFDRARAAFRICAALACRQHVGNGNRHGQVHDRTPQ